MGMHVSPCVSFCTAFYTQSKQHQEEKKKERHWKGRAHALATIQTTKQTKAKTADYDGHYEYLIQKH